LERRICERHKTSIMASSIETLQPQLIAINFAFPALSTIAVLLRIYIRVWTRTFAVGKETIPRCTSFRCFR
jgi:hypothetical protein